MFVRKLIPICSNQCNIYLVPSPLYIIICSLSDVVSHLQSTCSDLWPLLVDVHTYNHVSAITCLYFSIFIAVIHISTYKSPYTQLHIYIISLRALHNLHGLVRNVQSIYIAYIPVAYRCYQFSTVLTFSRSLWFLYSD